VILYSKKQLKIMVSVKEVLFQDVLNLINFDSLGSLHVSNSHFKIYIFSVNL